MSIPLQAWVLAGATATGKTAVAQALAEQLGTAILSSDAMLVYRGMDIGTAKPTPAERGDILYFGMDLVSPSEPFSTGLWLAEAARAFSSSGTSFLTVRVRPESGSGSDPTLIVAGGTGLYLKALTAGFDSEGADPAARAHWQAIFEQEGLAALQNALAARAPKALAALADPANPRRLIRALEHLDTRGRLPANWQQASAPTTVVALRLPREQLHNRIARRVTHMFEQGLVAEVRALRKAYPFWSATALQAIGYAEVCALLDGTLSEQAAFDKITARTRQLAKRQETWFRHQTQPIWIDIDDNDPPARIAQRVLETWRRHGPTPIQLP